MEAGYSSSLTELATRYVISNPLLSTMEIGVATLLELQQATTAVNKGPLSDKVLEKIREVQASFVTSNH